MCRFDVLQGKCILWRGLRLTISTLAAALGVMLALAAPPPATAHGASYPDGRLVEPAQRIDGLVGIDVPLHAWHVVLSTPESEQGEACVPLGRHGKIVLALAAHCTVKQGTTVYVIGITGWCSNLDEPPLFAESYRDQVKCIKRFYGREARPESMWVSVNGHRLADLHQHRYEILAPTQSIDVVPLDNGLGFPPGEIRYVVYGWGAWLVDLPVGTHRIQSRTVWPDGSEHLFDPVIEVVR